MGRAVTGAWWVGVNLVALLIGDATRNWLRNLRTVTPALGSMSLLLLLTGVAALAALAAGNVLRTGAAAASVVHVYLRSGAPATDVDTLIARLHDDPRVASVDYVSSAQALSDARRRPGLSQLIDDSGTNPFPASLDVRVLRLTSVGDVASSLAGQPAVDPAYPTSYDAGAYQSLERFIGVAGSIVAGILLALAAVSAAVTANAIRAAILARSDDVAIMRLLGASGWMVRGPFLFEGALTGEVAGVASAGALLALFAAAQRASAQVFTALLPGVDWGAALACAAGLVLAGIGLATVASVAGLRGLSR